MPTKKSPNASKWVDCDDAPHLHRGWFERAELREGDHVIRPAPAVGRPTKEVTKEAVNIRLDADVVAYFRATGRGWQSRINDALRKISGLSS
jgi:uncharacterized protein (DUF4415 family)